MMARTATSGRATRRRYIIAEKHERTKNIGESENG
jgi:hypothetical protein